MSKAILAIDPGTTESAYVLVAAADGKTLLEHGKLANTELLEWLAHEVCSHNPRHTTLVVEMLASYGMPVGREVFETCVWVGRFIQVWDGRWPYELMYRRDVKLHLCGSARAKDGNVRAALLDRYGPGRAVAVGTKRAPGPLYGVAGDVWAALAVAVTWADKQPSKRGA